jgi:phosphatidylserine decarboxylase
MNQYSRAEAQSQTAYPIAKAGYPFIFAAAFATAVFALSGLVTLALIGIFITGFICFFFRDPDRVIPNVENAIVSPADGKVIIVEKLEESDFYEGPCVKISIFMSVFNVHVNRIPFGGTVKKVAYFPGKFFSANLDKASRENEHNAVFIETEGGAPICMVQIAGLIARRIVCSVHQGHPVVKGQRMGLICFGSRVDVYLPADATPEVLLGDRVSAGTTILGRFVK